MVGVAIGVKSNTKAGGAVAITFMYLFDDFFAVGLHPVAWMYASEINSL